MRYRRARVPGATYFFTVVTAGRRPVLADPEIVADVRAALRSVMAAHPFSLEAIVIHPEHIHALWTLPETDTNYSTRWMLVKSMLTRRLHAKGIAGPIWQQRFWEHLIRDDDDYAAHADYIHYNPVKHGYAPHPAAWPWSSFGRWVEMGRYPKDWGGGGILLPKGVGRE